MSAKVREAKLLQQQQNGMYNDDESGYMADGRTATRSRLQGRQFHGHPGGSGESGAGYDNGDIEWTGRRHVQRDAQGRVISRGGFG